ncbi:MAG: NUDIX domain-containing protein [Chloroflexi bacterium]|nr:NUDIX domain-containing protein [Chloroflexota bacterium]
MVRKQPRHLHLTAIIAVGAVVYRYGRRRGFEVLLIKKRGGYWTLPKGRVRRSEEEGDAVAREVLEETGISGQVGAEVLQVSYVTPRRRRARRKIVTYYLVRAHEGAIATPGEQTGEAIEQVRWATPRAALRRIKRRRVRRVVDVATALLRLQDEHDPRVSQ